MWILDTGSSNHLVSPSSLPKKLRGAIEQNAHAVRLATANGIIEATDVIDVDIQSLGAKACVLVLPNTPAVLPIGRLIEDHGCTSKWTPDEASITDPDGGVHMCEVRNYVPHLDAGRDHDQHQHREDSCFLGQALPAGAADDSIIEHEAPDVAADMEGWSPANSSTMNSITFRSAQTAMRARKRRSR